MAGGGEFRVDTRLPKASASAAASGPGRVRVRCRSSESGRCSVRVVAGSSVARRLHLGRHATTLGRASASIHSPGRSLTVRLSTKARRALRRYGRAPVTVRVTITDAAGNAVTRSLRATVR